MHVDSLTFQIFILLAHSPHADLPVDHVDTRQTVPETGQNMGTVYCATGVVTKSDNPFKIVYIYTSTEDKFSFEVLFPFLLIFQSTKT